MQVQEHINLKPYLSFNTSVIASRLISVDDLHDLDEAVNLYENAYILGGGSNLLIAKDVIEIPILQINFKGISIVKENLEYDLVEIMAGEVWHDVVLWSLANGYGGLENMSLIPGKVGAAPIQNIGAYGVELKDVLHSVSCFDKAKACFKTYHVSECQFGYRESIFKRDLKQKVVISSITIKLSKQNHKINIQYGAISSWLDKHEISEPTPQQVSKAVISIRQSKLPNPEVLGNAGSFFKNIIVDKAKFTEMQREFPDMPYYNVGETMFKIPTGWMIEQCGWKGKRIGDTGCYENQALVIVNYGVASGAQILEHTKNVQQSVFMKFGLEITPEVNILV